MEENNSANSKNKSGRFFSITGNIVFAVLMLFIIYLLFITIKANICGYEPSLFKNKLYYVDSGSMTPAIPVGSLIVVIKTAPGDIKENDIITYRGSDKTLVTHRVIKILKNEKGFITSGDANKTNDPFPIKGEMVVGKVGFHIPYVGYILKSLKSWYGLAIILGILTLRIAVSLSKRSNKSKNKKL